MSGLKRQRQFFQSSITAGYQTLVLLNTAGAPNIAARDIAPQLT